MCYLSNRDYLSNLDIKYNFSYHFVKIISTEKNSDVLLCTIDKLNVYLSNGIILFENSNSKNIDSDCTTSSENIFSKRFYENKGIEAISSLHIKCNNKELSRKINKILIMYFDNFYDDNGYVMK